MIKIMIRIEGMRCGMCEAHIKDAVRKEFTVKKAKASYKKGEILLFTENDIDDTLLRRVIENTGYTWISAQREVKNEEKK